MQQMYVWGFELIRSLQSAGNPFLTLLMKAITLAGNPEAYLVLLPFLYWCVDEKRGFRIMFITILSAGCNTIIKEWLRVPRPFVQDPSIGLIKQTGYSTPSGHAQGSAVFWPSLTWLFLKPSTPGITSRPAQKIGRWIITLFVPFAIGLSRVYLGVHFPSDVLLGWMLGAVFACICLFAWDYIAAHLGKLPQSFKIVLLAVLIFIMNALCPVDRSMPGLLFGFGVGYIYLPKIGGYTAKSGNLWKKALRLLIGVGILIVLYAGLKKIFPQQASAQYALFRFIRYFIVGFWCGFGAPFLFIRLKLAEKGLVD